MAKSLVIVESPAKVKTINKILGDKFKVVSSMGHLIDLPKSDLGVNLEDKFTPKLIVVRSKQKILTQLKKDAQSKKDIYIATDPDREGEAIGWNLLQHIGDGKNHYRVTFQEITKEAVLKAFEHPRKFDLKKVNAQVARRILDRIVGYLISPILWKKVGSRLSAGRVQSVALRLIVDRERAIRSFIPQEYWQMEVDLRKKGLKNVLTAGLEKINDKKPELKTKEETDAIALDIQNQAFMVSNIIEREVKRNPSPPFITSTLQQEAFNKLGFNANKTMLLAQQLYEGIELGDDEPVGLITYMRTDSVNIAQEALTKVRHFISKAYGEKYLPEKPNVYKSKKSAQEAHEAIRPSDISRNPKDVQKYLDGDQFKLYELIWKRFVGCQMVPAVYENRKVEITAGKYAFGVSGSHLVFDGFYVLGKDEKDDTVDLSPYKKNDPLELVEVKPTQHFTKPPPRFSEASLVKALEEDGIGRPSTYASIIHTLVLRNYALRERGYFSATDLGIKICDLLVEYFPKIMDITFTAQMEESLDQIEEGEIDQEKLLRDFYGPFKIELDYAMQNITKTHEFVEKKCPECGRPMVIKWGRRGQFISCSGFPKCKYAEAITTGVKCPQEGCAGELVKRRSPRGSFYGCSKYPNCTYIANKLPGEGDDEKVSTTADDKK
ncbi:MAG: DNA topoisomerase I [Omnitrophica WOR_2 bacterium GWA2_47_8]|nr:MAG: DNA topoisomerase I [Omnitrophica WOR_2 bacterium GWA2_47_8]